MTLWQRAAPPPPRDPAAAALEAYYDLEAPSLERELVAPRTGDYCVNHVLLEHVTGARGRAVDPDPWRDPRSPWWMRADAWLHGAERDLEAAQRTRRVIEHARLAERVTDSAGQADA